MRVSSLLYLSLAAPLLAQNTAPALLTATHSEHFTVSAAGALRLENSFGEVDIEGWDRPEVEITVVRTSEHYFDAQHRTEIQKRLDGIQVATKQAGNDVTISTTYPPRRAWLHWMSRRSDVELHYIIHAPRESKLTIGHNSGGVNVSGITGQIHAAVFNGQITLTLDAAPTSIDAECKLGHVYSDFDGSGRRRHFIGNTFTQGSATSAGALFLRVSIGDVILQKSTLPPVN